MHTQQRMPDETLAQEVMPPMLVALGVLAAFAFGLLMLNQHRADVWPYLLNLALVASIWACGDLLRRERLRAAGSLLAYTLALLPVLSITAFGVADNVMIYLAPI